MRQETRGVRGKRRELGPGELGPGELGHGFSDSRGTREVSKGGEEGCDGRVRSFSDSGGHIATPGGAPRERQWRLIAQASPC